MNNAVAFKQLPAGQFECSAHGCVNRTDGHYCIWHTATCESCGGEGERGEMLRGLCTACQRSECALDRADGYSAECVCSQHGAVR